MPRPRVWGSTWAGFGLRPNPLRRRIDRVEAFSMVALVLVFAFTAPLAASSVGHWARTTGLASARAEQAAWRQVKAVIIKGVPKPRDDPYGNLDTAQVPARWIAPDGSIRTGRVTAALGTPAGGTIKIWTNRSGIQTGPPLGRAQVGHQAMLAAVTAVLGVMTLLIVTGLIIQWMLERRRLAAWDAEWRATGPLWNNNR